MNVEDENEHQQNYENEGKLGKVIVGLKQYGWEVGKWLLAKIK